MILERLFGRAEQRATKGPSGPPRDPVIADWLGASTHTASGISVRADNATRLIAVFAAVRILAESLASLPLGVIKRNANGTRAPAPEHPLHTLLHRQPNRFQTSFEWREMLMGHLCLRGNAYCELIYSGTKLLETLPLHPDKVRPFRAPNGEIAYEHTPDTGRPRTLLAADVLHLRGLSRDGLKGMSPIDEARESIGLALAAEEFGGRFFGNGTQIGGNLEHPGKLSDTAYERLKKSFEDRHQGVGRAHRPAILEEGMKWQALGIEPEKAQFLETRKFQITEIARLFRIPPHMLADLERATFSNIEQQSIEFVVHTLRPWLERWEQRLNLSLLSDQAQTQYEIKFSVEGLLRGDSAARATFYRELWGLGVLSPNEIRAYENLNPVDGGDHYYVPVNYAATDAPVPAPKSPTDPQNKPVAETQT